jgi:hypothetical protein
MDYSKKRLAFLSIETTEKDTPPVKVPLQAITIHPDHRPNHSQRRCYFSTIDMEGVKRECHAPFAQTLLWFMHGMYDSPQLTSISIRAIAALLDVEELTPAEGDLPIESEFTQLMGVLLAATPVTKQPIQTFDFQIRETEDPYELDSRRTVPFHTIKTPLRYYFEIVPYWVDTLHYVTFRTLGWCYEEWVTLFTPNRLTRLRLDITRSPFDPLRKVVNPEPVKSDFPLQELRLDFCPRSGQFSQGPYAPLVQLIQGLSPTGYFLLDLPNHINLFRHLFGCLAIVEALGPFQKSLRILEFGSFCCSVLIGANVLTAFPNLNEIRGIRLHAALLICLGRWLAGIGLREEQVDQKVDLLFNCLPANSDHQFLSLALSKAYSMRLLPEFKPLKIDIFTPSNPSGPIATIIMTHENHTASHPRQFTLKVPYTSESETGDVRCCICP